MLHGTLRDEIGSALGGAQLLLSAWPSAAARRAMPVGSSFAITPVARTQADAQGRFLLRTAMSPALSALQDRDGIDLELDVFTRGQHLLHLTQARRDPASGAWVREAVTDPRDALATLGAGLRNQLDITLDTRLGTPTRNQLRDQPSAPAGDHVSFPQCTKWTKQPSKSAMETVATAAARNGVKIQTMYTSSASTSSGTGASFNGGISFAQAGTRSRTSTFSGDFFERRAPKNGLIDREYRIEWRHFVSDRYCALTPDQREQHQVLTDPDIPTGAGGDRATKTPAWSCEGRAKHAGLTHVSTEHARAKIYDTGFSINPMGLGGFTGTSQSGYSNDVKVTFEFSKKNGGQWCGDTDVPTADNQRVQAFQ